MTFDPKKLEETPVNNTNATERRPENAVDFTSEHEDMLNELSAMKAGHYNFLDSVYDWGTEKGWLTEAQDQKLRELYNEQ